MSMPWLTMRSRVAFLLKQLFCIVIWRKKLFDLKNIESPWGITSDSNNAMFIVVKCWCPVTKWTWGDAMNGSASIAPHDSFTDTYLQMNLFLRIPNYYP